MASPSHGNQARTAREFRGDGEKWVLPADPLWYDRIPEEANLPAWLASHNNTATATILDSHAVEE